MPRRGDDDGSVALLAVLGGGLTLLMALAPLAVVADLLVTRGRAQTAADAAALAAMGDAAGDGRDVADALARANGAAVLACCGDDPARRHVTVSATPASTLLAAVVPHVEAEAAAALIGGGVAGGLSPGPVGPVGPGGRVWPVDAPVTSGFGTRVHPLTGSARLHAGLDLGAPAGTPVRAAAAGAVVAAGVMGGYGNTVDIRHADGSITRYARQSRVLVRAGQRVAGGTGPRPGRIDRRVDRPSPALRGPHRCRPRRSPHLASKARLTRMSGLSWTFHEWPRRCGASVASGGRGVRDRGVCGCAPWAGGGRSDSVVVRQGGIEQCDRAGLVERLVAVAALG